MRLYNSSLTLRKSPRYLNAVITERNGTPSVAGDSGGVREAPPFF